MKSPKIPLFKRLIAYTLIWLLFSQHTLLIAAELISLERAEFYKTEKINFHQIILPPQDHELKWELSNDLSNLKHLMVIYTSSSTKPLAALYKTETGEISLNIYKEYTVQLESIPQNLPLLTINSIGAVSLNVKEVLIPLNVYSSAVQFLQNVRIDSAVDLWAKGDLATLTALELGKPTPVKPVTVKLPTGEQGKTKTIQAVGEVRTQTVTGKGSLSIFAGRFKNSQSVRLEHLSLIANAENEENGDLCGSQSLWLEGILRNKGSIRTKGYLTEAGNIRHEQTAQVFAGVYHQVKANVYRHDGRMHSAILSHIVGREVEYGPHYSFVGQRFITKASKLITDPATRIQAQFYIELTSPNTLYNDAKLLVRYTPFPYERYFGTFGKLSPQQRDTIVKLTRGLQDYVGAAPLNEQSRACQDLYGVLLASDKESVSQQGEVEASLTDIVYRARSQIDHTGVSRSGTKSIPTTIKVFAQRAFLKGRIEGSLEAHIQEHLSMDLHLQSPFSKVFAKSLDLAGKIEGYLLAEIEKIITFNDLQATALAAQAPVISIPQGAKVSVDHVALRADQLNQGGDLRLGSGGVAAKVFRNTGKTTVAGQVTLEAKETFENLKEIAVPKGGHLDVHLPKDPDVGHLTGDGSAAIRAEKFEDPVALAAGKTDAKLGGGLHVHTGQDVIITENLIAKDPMGLTAHNMTLKARAELQKGGELAATGDLNMPGQTIESGKGLKIYAGRNLNAPQATVSVKQEDLRMGAREHVDVTRAHLTDQQGDVVVVSEEKSVSARGAELTARKDVRVHAAEDVIGESIQAQQNIDYGYRQYLIQAIAKAGRYVVYEAGRNILFLATKTQSGEGTTFRAGGDTVDRDCTLVTHYDKPLKNGGYSRGTTWRKRTSEHHTAEGKFISYARGAQHLFGPKISADKIIILGEKGVHVYDARLSGGNESPNGSYFFSRSIPAQFISKNPVEIISLLGDIDLINAHFDAPRAILRALSGQVRFLLGVNETLSSGIDDNSNLFFQSITQRLDHHRTNSACRGIFDVQAKEIFAQQVRGQTHEFLKHLETHGTPITFEYLDELHRVEEKTFQGLTPAAGIVIGLAAAIATSGASLTVGGAAGSIFTNATASAMVSGMSSAAFSAVASQAAIALVNYQGNIGKAAQTLANSTFLKSVALSALTAGIADGLGVQLGIPMTAAGCQSIAQHASRYALRAGVSMGVGIATGQDAGDAALGAARTIAAGLVQTYLAGEIGAARRDPDMHMDFFTHKMLHAVSAALGGAIGSKDALAGAIAAGLGAAVGETVAEMSKQDDEAITARVKAKAEAEGIEPTKENIKPLVAEEYRSVLDAARLTAAVAALLAGQDVNIAAEAAAVAVENNNFDTKADNIAKTLKAKMNEAIDYIADGIASAADYIEQHQEGIELGCTMFMAGVFQMQAADKGVGKAPLKTPQDRKADGILGKGAKGFAKAAPKHLRQAEEKVRGLKSDQPWTIRPGQEYKEKIVGRAQKTGTAAERAKGAPGNGHAMRAYREAIAAAKRDDVDKVFLNRGIRKSSGHPIEKPNSRPDVTFVTRDSKVHQREVPSVSDRPEDLMARMEVANSKLPEHMQGTRDLSHMYKEVR